MPLLLLILLLLLLGVRSVPSDSAPVIVTTHLTMPWCPPLPVGGLADSPKSNTCTGKVAGHGSGWRPRSNNDAILYIISRDVCICLFMIMFPP
jgi:hypothetical protein